ncbi:MAG TPA: SulP family inorganic anion transporter [Candidatus Limnocylindrales bacterium]
MTAAARSRLPKRPTFMLGGLLPLDSKRLPLDLIAGATLAALAIPEVMGYTKIAGTPVITGLYTLLLPVFLFALFGSSRHLVVGADSASAAILATGLLAMGQVADSPTYVAMASLVALMCAVLLVVARLVRLGFIANFLSRSVLIGFLTGVGIQVAMGQVGGMFGISGETGRTVQKFLDTLAAVPTQTNVPTLIVSIAVIATIVILERVARRIPGALIAVVGSILLSYTFNLAASGVSTLGPVPGGLPSLSLPSGVITADNISTLLPTVISIVVVILAQSAATSRAYALRYGDSFDENVDLIGLGLANAGAGLSGTFVVNGSPTKTEMVDSAGGRSQVAQLTTGVIVIAVLLFLTGPLAYMPNAVLASVVFIIGLKLVDIRGMLDIYRLRFGEFIVALITAATVVVIGVEQGIIVAMALSVIEHISHSYRPFDNLLAWDKDGSRAFQPLATNSQAEPGLAIYAFGASLYYANSARFTEELMALVEGADPPLRWLAISCSAIGDVDYSGADAISKLVDELSGKGITLSLCDVSPQLRKLLDAYELTNKIGADRIFDTAKDLSAAFKTA